MTNRFSDKVRAIVKKIPKGKTLTYAEVARRAGNIQAARAVGAIMRANRDPSIPCHRIIRSDGKLGGYNRLRGKTKRQLLTSERTHFNANQLLLGRETKGTRSLF